MAERRILPDVRPSTTHKFKIRSPQGDFSCWLTIGFYDEGMAEPGEVFIRIGKQGSTLNGLLDTVGILLSYGLQYGVPLADLCGKLKQMTFDPAGSTSNPDIERCTSLIDYVFTYLEAHYVEAAA